MTKRQQRIYIALISKEVGLNFKGLMNVYKEYQRIAINDLTLGRKVNKLNYDRLVASAEAIKLYKI